MKKKEKIKQFFFDTNIPKLYMIMLSLIMIISLGCYSSYAFFTVQREKQNALSIVTRGFVGKITINEKEENTIEVEANTTKYVDVSLSNISDKRARFNLYYQGNLGNDAEVGYLEREGYNIPPRKNGVNLSAKGTLGSVETYKVKVKNKSDHNIKISLGYEVGFDYNDLSLENDYHELEKVQNVSAVDTLLVSYTNGSSIQNYDTNHITSKEKKMYVFSHKQTIQQSDWSNEEQTDYRYIGSSPNNYVKFNNEEWRIVGIFTVENENGTREKRIKIVREDYLPLHLSWDRSTDEEATGKNKWEGSTLQLLLNEEIFDDKVGSGLYWNRKVGSCYGGDAANIDIHSCDFSTVGLLPSEREKIKKTKWYLGEISSTDSEWLSYGTTEDIYQKERGNLMLESTIAPRKLFWMGNVALLYPSDYGFTYAYGVDENCYSNITQCTNKSSSYLYHENLSGEFLISPRNGYSNMVILAGICNNNGFMCSTHAQWGLQIRPSIYLDTNIKLLNGVGSKEEPFVFTE